MSTSNQALLLQLTWNGIVVGAIYALMAFGFALIYYTTRILHFAHGAVAVFASYGIYFISIHLGVGWLAAAFLALPLAFALGVLFNLILYRPVVRAQNNRFRGGALLI